MSTKQTTENQLEASQLTKTTTQQQANIDVTLSFEQAIAELETIVGKMETGSLALEASLNAYKRGAALVSICQQSLSNAEQQVRILSEANKLTVFNVSDSQ
jgi:exodeoxyribonuclease VII small subunit